jgi:zinc/manganese transport system substrate-binding protein
MKKLLISSLFWLSPTVVLADPLQVLASFSIVGNLVQEIGGERVNVTTLVGADQDAHVYQPAPQDVKKLNRASVFVVNGLGFEGWVSRLAKSSGFKGKTVIASAGIAPQNNPAGQGEHGHSGQDPHAWHNPQNVKVYVRNIAAALTQADPSGKDYYAQRLTRYAQQLDEADTFARAQFERIPRARRQVVTSHEAFAYLAQHYQIRFIAPQGISTDAEASAKGVAQLVRQVRHEKIKAVFVENMTDSRLVAQLSREAGVTVGGKLYADALSAPGTAADTYLKFFRYNVTTLMGGLNQN